LKKTALSLSFELLPYLFSRHVKNPWQSSTTICAVHLSVFLVLCRLFVCVYVPLFFCIICVSCYLYAMRIICGVKSQW
jgi:hypothetical protein